jgi:death-on-curing family protein
MIQPLTIEHVDQLAHRLAREIMSWDEPIPDFGTRFPNILESCLSTPFQTFSKRDLYPRLEDKAAMLFYLLIKNHPFENGNKRVAVTSLLVFLHLNGHWLESPPDDLYRMAVWVAESLPVAKEGVCIAISDFIRKNVK